MAKPTIKSNDKWQRGKIFAKKGLVSGTYKELLQINKKHGGKDTDMSQ